MRAKVESAGRGSDDGGIGDNGGAGGGLGWVGLAAHLIVIKEPEIFRLVVGYL